MLLRYFSYLNTSRLLNLLKLWGSYQWARFSKKPVRCGMPAALSVEPCSHCNLACPQCPTGMGSLTRASGNLSPELFKIIIDQSHRHLISLLLYFQGEPFLNPDIFTMVAYAQKHKIFTSLSTNGHFLTPVNCKMLINSGLQHIVISVDGTTQQTYGQYRRKGTLQQVVEGIVQLVKTKATLGAQHPYIEIQFLVLSTNQHQIGEMQKLAKKWQVDKLSLKTAQFYDFENGNPLMPDIEKYSRYQKNSNGRYQSKSRMSNRCWKMWHSAVISVSGDIVPCCFDKNAQHVMGNVTRENLKTIWQGDVYAKFLHRILHNRSQILMCKNCSEGLRVKY